MRLIWMGDAGQIGFSELRTWAVMNTFREAPCATSDRKFQTFSQIKERS